jgi:CHASE3 domain sensor protein
VKTQRQLASLSGIFVAFALCAIFAASGIEIHRLIANNLTEQRQLRTAQIYRARLLRLQLDEETGIRGYEVTSKRGFLSPFYDARREFNGVADTMTATLHQLSMDDRLVREEWTVNDQWLAQVAEPTLRNPRASVFLVQTAGKSLVDGFRKLDSSLFTQLTLKAAAADDAASDLVTRLLIGSLAFGLLLALIFTGIAALGSRLGARLEAQRKAYEQEKFTADTLQQAFRRGDLPKVPGISLDGVYVPAGLEAQVGGDWYDAFELPSGRMLFSIGDVAGHGVEAAVIMSRARQTILASAIEGNDPGIVLAQTNRVLRLQDVTMVTSICGVIDLAQRSVSYACAGHHPIVTLLAGELHVLSTGGPPLGVAGDVSYETFSTPAVPGAMLVLYTDGLVEYSRDLEAGERALLEACRTLDRTARHPARRILHAVLHGKPPADDVAILTIGF